jgi:hypothetical protein
MSTFVEDVRKELERKSPVRAAVESVKAVIADARMNGWLSLNLP